MQECKGEQNLHLSEVDFPFNLTLRDRRLRLKKTSLVPVRGLTREKVRALWEASSKEATFTGFSIIGTVSLTGKPQRARRKPMPNAY